jgi:phospholipid/cholesterol/gamma-HCH transport system substrate-binding protein
METKANYVAVGAFVLTCVIGLVVTILWLTGEQYNQEYQYFQTYFTGAVTGLGKGTVTRYNGIDVGRVASLAFDPKDPQRVIVTLQVQPGLNIREDSEAAIESQGLTGGNFVEISGGTAKSPLLTAREGQRYPVIRSRQSTLQQLEQSAPEVVAKLNVAVTRINDVLNDNNRQAFGAILANLNTTTTAIARRSGDIEGALHNANATMDNLRVATSTLTPTIHDADLTVRKLGKVADDTDAFINGDGLAQISDLMRELRHLTANLTKFSDQLNREPTKLLFGDRRKGYEPKDGAK